MRMHSPTLRTMLDQRAEFAIAGFVNEPQRTSLLGEMDAKGTRCAERCKDNVQNGTMRRMETGMETRRKGPGTELRNKPPRRLIAFKTAV